MLDSKRGMLEVAIRCFEWLRKRERTARRWGYLVARTPKGRDGRALPLPSLSLADG